MNSLLNRWLPAVTLLTWSAVLIHAHLSGRVVALLAPAFRGGVLVAGLGLALVGLVFLCTPQNVACCAGERCGHAFAKAPAGRLLTFLVLLLPISLGREMHLLSDRGPGPVDRQMLGREGGRGMNHHDTSAIGQWLNRDSTQMETLLSSRIQIQQTKGKIQPGLGVFCRQL